MNLKNKFHKLQLANNIITIAKDIKSKGGELLLVWGCVRDMILWLESSDLDIEVYWIGLERLEKVLSRYGEIFSVWKAFWILKVYINGTYVDFSVPRIDSKVTSWHTGFEVKINDSLSFYEASKRRDFTINSILYSPLSDTLIDPHDGCKDLNNKIIRVTDKERFSDDPLRVYRWVRFAWRFWFEIEPESKILFQRMLPSISELSKERIWDEWRKIFLQSKNIRNSLELLFDLGILSEYYPSVVWLKFIPQDTKWHPEWDVWIHTCMVVEQAQWIAEREGFTDEERLILYFSALCHDLWKLTHTQILDEWKITAHWHEEAWVNPTKIFLQNLFFPENTIEKISNLIANHVTPSVWYSDEFFRNIHITDWAFRKLAKRLFPANMKELSYLCESDTLGRWEADLYSHTTIKRTFLPWNWIRNRSEGLWININPAPNILSWKELIILGIIPWPKIWELIRYANSLHDDLWMTKDWIIQMIRIEK